MNQALCIIRSDNAQGVFSADSTIFFCDLQWYHCAIL